MAHGAVPAQQSKGKATVVQARAGQSSSYMARNHYVRLVSKSTRLYLHLSGSGQTSDVQHSWSGTRKQAKAMIALLKERGEPHDYKGEWAYK